jgi:hypothetical protein
MGLYLQYRRRKEAVNGGTDGCTGWFNERRKNTEYPRAGWGMMCLRNIAIQPRGSAWTCNVCSVSRRTPSDAARVVEASGADPPARDNSAKLHFTLWVGCHMIGYLAVPFPPFFPR